MYNWLRWRVLRVPQPLSDRRAKVPERRHLQRHHNRKLRPDLPVHVPHRLLAFVLRGSCFGQCMPRQSVQQRWDMHLGVQPHQLHLLMPRRMERWDPDPSDWKRIQKKKIVPRIQWNENGMAVDELAVSTWHSRVCLHRHVILSVFTLSLNVFGNGMLLIKLENSVLEGMSN